MRDLLLSILAGALGQVFLKKGMSSIGGVSLGGMLEKPLAVALNPWVAGGFAMYAASFALWLVVLSKVELSKAYPMVSLGYLLTFVLGIVLFGESVSVLKCCGLGLIMTGVVLLAWS
ncbi:MAG TPA: SMR family transporter [Fibrobacteria bacterium]|nr:SMR family transporter [Fibrobacteria bacterium]